MIATRTVNSVWGLQFLVSITIFACSFCEAPAWPAEPEIRSGYAIGSEPAFVISV
jgi:hypothetical protein